MLTFEHENHIYRWNGAIVPCVSDIVNNVTDDVFYGVTDWHLQRGRMVHLAIKLFLQGRLDEKTVDERIRGRVEAAKTAIKELSLKKPYLIETPLYHDIYNFAGTPDLLAGRVLADWKSMHKDSAEIQVGGYQELLTKNKHKVNEVIEITLGDNGKYKVYPYRTKRIKRLFLACLTMSNFLEGR